MCRGCWHSAPSTRHTFPTAAAGSSPRASLQLVTAPASCPTGDCRSMSWVPSPLSSAAAPREELTCGARAGREDALGGGTQAEQGSAPPRQLQGERLGSKELGTGRKGWRSRLSPGNPPGAPALSSHPRRQPIRTQIRWPAGPSSTPQSSFSSTEGT